MQDSEREYRQEREQPRTHMSLWVSGRRLCVPEEQEETRRKTSSHTGAVLSDKCVCVCVPY